MTDIGDERKHKPSAKHTLEEVRKSLEDLVRNEFVDAGPAPTQDTETSDQPDRSSALAPSPPQRSHQRLQTMQKRDLATSQVLASLNELIGGALSESDQQDSAAVADTTLTPPSLESAGEVQPSADADKDVVADATTPESDDMSLTDDDMSGHTESLETLAAKLAVDDETNPDADIDTSDPHRADLEDHEISADAKSLESIAAELASEDDTETSTSDAGRAEEISWEEFSDADTGDVSSTDDTDHLEVTTGPTVDVKPPAEPEEITLAAVPEPVPEAVSSDQALRPAASTEEQDIDADMTQTPDTTGIEVSLDEPEADMPETTTSPSSDSLSEPRLSIGDDHHGPEPTKGTASRARDSAPMGVDVADGLEESMEYPEDEADQFASEAQQTFDFDALEAGQGVSQAAKKSPKPEAIDETRPKEPHETAEIPDESPRQAGDSGLRLEDAKSVLVEPAGERAPLVPDEEISMELGEELEASGEAPLSADDTLSQGDSPTLSPMDALEIPGEDTTSRGDKEEDHAAMHNRAQEHSTTAGRERADATTVLLTPDQVPPEGQEPDDAPTLELEHPAVEPEPTEPTGEAAKPATATPVETPPAPKPAGTKEESTPVVTLPTDKPAEVSTKAPSKSPKHKAFTVASAYEAKELKMPGIDFDLGTAADKRTGTTGPQPPSSSTTKDTSSDDAEYIDLAEPATATDTAPIKSSKASQKRPPWPTPSALFRKDSAPKPKRMPWGQNKGMGARAKGSPRAIEPSSTTAKTNVSAKTPDSPTLKQPKPKATVDQSAESIPVLNEVVDQPAQSKKPKKKPAPLATPKVTSSGASRKKQTKHKTLDASSATPKVEARNVAVNVIAKLNMELRKCGERALSPVTIDRLQFLLREALERYAKDVENSPKRR